LDESSGGKFPYNKWTLGLYAIAVSLDDRVDNPDEGSAVADAAEPCAAAGPQPPSKWLLTRIFRAYRPIQILRLALLKDSIRAAAKDIAAFNAKATERVNAELGGSIEERIASGGASLTRASRRAGCPFAIFVVYRVQEEVASEIGVEKMGKGTGSNLQYRAFSKNRLARDLDYRHQQASIDFLINATMDEIELDWFGDRCFFSLYIPFHIPLSALYMGYFFFSIYSSVLTQKQKKKKKKKKKSGK
jgi:hypothetical protein